MASADDIQNEWNLLGLLLVDFISFQSLVVGILIIFSVGEKNAEHISVFNAVSHFLFQMDTRRIINQFFLGFSACSKKHGSGTDLLGSDFMNVPFCSCD